MDILIENSVVFMIRYSSIIEQADAEIRFTYMHTLKFNMVY